MRGKVDMDGLFSIIYGTPVGKRKIAGSFGPGIIEKLPKPSEEELFFSEQREGVISVPIA